MIIAPEQIIFDFIKALLKLTREDYKSNPDKTKTILGLIWSGIILQRYNFSQQGWSVFDDDEANPRYLDVNMFFNSQRATIPTIHITLPSEDPAQDGLGVDEGYQDSIGLEDEYRKTFTRRYKSNYSIIVTSDNTHEVSLISRTLHALLQSSIQYLSVRGLENVKLSFRDIQLNANIVPTNVFARAVGLSFEYENTTPDLFLTEKLLAVNFGQSDIILNGVKYETNLDDDESNS